jgi:hypothetical protein
MTDFLTIGFTILASCTTYFICSTLFQKLEAYLRCQQQRQCLKDTVIVSRELRSWVSIFYAKDPQDRTLNIQTAPITLDLQTKTHPAPSASNFFSTLLPVLSSVTPYLINYFLSRPSQREISRSPQVPLPCVVPPLPRELTPSIGSQVVPPNNPMTLIKSRSLMESDPVVDQSISKPRSSRIESSTQSGPVPPIKTN